MERRRTFIRGLGTGVVAVSAGCLTSRDSREPATNAGDDAESSSERATKITERGDVDRVIRVSGRRYAFTPGSETPIVATLGEEVQVIFRSLDDGYHGGHGFAIDAYGVDLRATEGEEDTTTFTADRAGTFEVYCSVYCGEGHPGMEGTFVVEESG